MSQIMSHLTVGKRGDGTGSKHGLKCRGCFSVLSSANAASYWRPLSGPQSVGNSLHPALPKLSAWPEFDSTCRWVPLTIGEIRIHFLRFCQIFHGHCLNIPQKFILWVDTLFTVTVTAEMKETLSPDFKYWSLNHHKVGLVCPKSLINRINQMCSLFCGAVSYHWQGWLKMGVGSQESQSKFNLILSPASPLRHHFEFSPRQTSHNRC